MRKTLPATVVCALALIATACSKTEVQALPAAPPPPAAPPFKLTASVQEIMEAMVDPHADGVWESVGTTITRESVVEHQPRTDEEWRAVRLHALALVESTNLLMMQGRKLVPLGCKICDEGSQVVLSTEEGEKLLVSQHDAFVGYASALGEVAGRMLKAIDARQVDQMIEIGTDMDEVCERCHMTFWYPNQKFPAA